MDLGVASYIQYTAASRTCGAMYLFVPSDFTCWHLISPMLLAILTSISRSFLDFRLKGNILRNKRLFSRRMCVCVSVCLSMCVCFWCAL